MSDPERKHSAGNDVNLHFFFHLGAIRPWSTRLILVDLQTSPCFSGGLSKGFGLQPPGRGGRGLGSLPSGDLGAGHGAGHGAGGARRGFSCPKMVKIQTTSIDYP